MNHETRQPATPAHSDRRRLLMGNVHADDQYVRFNERLERCYAVPLERATKGRCTFVGDRVVSIAKARTPRNVREEAELNA